jgi:hypothetical protein
MSDNLKKYALAALILAAAPVSVAWGHPSKTYATLHPSEPVLAADQSRIYLYRESSLFGGAMQPEIRINGEDSGGDTRSGDYFYVDRPAGTYEISTTTEKKESLSVTLTPGQSIYVRFNVSMGVFLGHVTPSLIDPQQAAEEIKDCDFKAPKPIAGAPVSAAPAQATTTAVAPTATTSAAPATTAAATALATSAPAPTADAPKSNP